MCQTKRTQLISYLCLDRSCGWEQSVLIPVSATDLPSVVTGSVCLLCCYGTCVGPPHVGTIVPPSPSCLPGWSAKSTHVTSMLKSCMNRDYCMSPSLHVMTPVMSTPCVPFFLSSFLVQGKGPGRENTVSLQGTGLAPWC